MQNLQLFINDNLVDLAADTSIELIYQINNLAEVANQQGNTSKQFRLPLTQNNRRILGFPDDMRFTSDAPYTQYECKVVQDGLEIIPLGIGEVNGADDNYVDFVILSGNVDFFDALGGSVYEMGDATSQYGGVLWAPYDHTWSLANVAGSQTKTEGWIWPIIDYGQLPLSDFTEPINVRYMRPGFFLHTAIDILAKLTGYSINPNSFLLKQPLYKKLIVQFANDSFEHGSDYQNRPDQSGVNALTAANQEVSHIPIFDNKGMIHFFNEVSDPLNQFDGTNFTSSKIMGVSITLNIPQLWFRGRVNETHPSRLDINIFQISAGGESVLTTLSYDFENGFTRVDGTSGGNLQGYITVKNKKATIETNLEAGDIIRVGYEFFGDRPAFFNLYAGASLVITPKSVEVLYSQTVQCERIFPDVSQKDLLKDTLQRFGITCQTDNVNKQITLSSFRDIVNNIPRAKDWTFKCLDQGKKTVFQLGNYSQINWLRYQDDDGIPLNKIPKYFADDHIDISDKTLNPNTKQADLFVSIFGPSSNRPWYGGTIAEITKVDPEGDSLDFTISTKPRILINQTIDLRTLGAKGGSKSVTFTDGQEQIIINDIVSVPYFYKPDGENLAWKDLPNNAGGMIPGLRSQYYPEIEKILKQTKKVTRFFLLSPRDILELDLLTPVFLEQDSAYYYINKIDSWKKGQPTKVELVRL